MSKVTIEAVQKVLNLDAPYPSVPTSTELLEFTVDGVIVKAVATHAWRRITIQIVEPFDIEAWTFQPPLIALGISMLHRKEWLKERGVTDSEDCLIRARTAYLRHVAYLKVKPTIDAAQEEFAKSFDNELASLLLEWENVRSRVNLEKKEESRKFRAGEISQKEYQSILKMLESQAREASQPYSQLKDQVDRELSGIKESMMDEILDDESNNG